MELTKLQKDIKWALRIRDKDVYEPENVWKATKKRNIVKMRYGFMDVITVYDWEGNEVRTVITFRRDPETEEVIRALEQLRPLMQHDRIDRLLKELQNVKQKSEV